MKYVIFAICALLLASAGCLYLMKGSVRTEEDGEPVRLQALLSRKQIFLTAAVSACVGAALACYSVIRFDDTLEYTLKLLLIFEWLTPIALIDGRCHIIQNRMILFGLAAFLLFTAAEWLLLHVSLWALVKNALLGFAMGIGVFGLGAILSKGGMGAGDIKLFGVLGMLLGWEGTFLLIFLTVLLTALTGIILILAHKKERSSRLPAGPFVLLAMGTAMLLGI